MLYWGTQLFGLAVSVRGHFGHDISVHKQLITFVYGNDYIDWRNVTPNGVIPAPFWGVMIAIKSELYIWAWSICILKNADNDLKWKSDVDADWLLDFGSCLF